MVMKFAIGVYCLVGVLMMYGGCNCLTPSEFMPYHAQAIQAAWRSLTSEQQGLILSLLEGCGAGAVAIGGTIVLLAVIGLPRRTAFAFWLLSLVTLVYLAFATYFMNTRTHGGPLSALWLALGAPIVVVEILSRAGRGSLAMKSEG